MHQEYTTNRHFEIHNQKNFLGRGLCLDRPQNIFGLTPLIYCSALKSILHQKTKFSLMFHCTYFICGLKYSTYPGSRYRLVGIIDYNYDDTGQ